MRTRESLFSSAWLVKNRPRNSTLNVLALYRRLELTVEAFVPVATQCRVEAVVHELSTQRIVVFRRDQITSVDQPHQADVMEMLEEGRVLRRTLFGHFLDPHVLLHEVLQLHVDLGRGFTLLTNGVEVGRVGRVFLSGLALTQDQRVGELQQLHELHLIAGRARVRLGVLALLDVL